jgi:hypothetical protein
MADGNLVRQSNVGKDSVVFGPTVYDVPLLPYERQLIQTIGITEEEYRKFAAEVRRRGRLKPAEYEHIPDIRCEATTIILVNLAISLVLTGVAYLLTPKPKMPEARKGGGVIEGDSFTGPTRFTPSRGFETLATLANYAEPIPIIFGLYDEKDDVGGMLVTPKLVWSRMFSYGTQQQAKLLFVVGEQGLTDNEGSSGMPAPDLGGIFIGNNALDQIFDDQFTFYYKQNTFNSPRIIGSEKLYGTRARFRSGDPDGVKGDEEVFTCPTRAVQREPAFCHAFSPANGTEFGLYGPIANGTSYRLNYRSIVVFRDEDSTTGRTIKNQIADRVKHIGDRNFARDSGENFDYNSKRYKDEVRKDELKFAGGSDDNNSQPDAKGRAYSPRMGIFRIQRENGSIVECASNQDKFVTSVAEGDKAFFRISPSQIASDIYKSGGRGPGVEDINDTVRALQRAADDAMQLGELFSIGGVIWQVVSRRITRYDPDFDTRKQKYQEIELVCIDTSLCFGIPQLGIVNLDLVIQPNADRYDYYDDIKNIGEAFFPITKISTATLRNNRPAAVTEIGLKSTVFQQLRGLCAFSGTLSPNELVELAEKNTTVQDGTFTGSIVRSSMFRIFIRNAGKGNQDESPYVAFPEIFVIKGSTPTPQYNSFTVTLPSDREPAELEFKFVPLSAAEIRLIDDNDANTLFSVISNELKDNDENTLTSEARLPGTKLGRVKITYKGERVPRLNITRNKEFFRGESFLEQEKEVQRPDVVEKSTRLPASRSGYRVTAIARVSNLGFYLVNGNAVQMNTDFGKNGAFSHEIAGSADTGPYSGLGVNGITDPPIRTREWQGKNWIVIDWTFRKIALPSTHYAYANGARHAWVPNSADVVGSSSNGFGKHDQFDVLRGKNATNVPPGGSPSQALTNSNPFKRNNPGRPGDPPRDLASAGRRFRVTDNNVVDIVGGRTQGYHFELFGNAENLPVGQESVPVFVNFSKGSKKLRLQLTSTVMEFAGNNSFSGQTKGWNNVTVKVVQDSGTTNNWRVGDTVTHLVPINIQTNPFYNGYEQTPGNNDVGFIYRITSVPNLVRQEVSNEGTSFITNSQVSDISLYRELVEKSNNTSPEHEIVYVNEILETDIDGERAANFNSLTQCGLSLKASRHFTRLDQLRIWLAKGVQVKRFGGDTGDERNKVYGDSAKIGSSNLFPDLVHYLLTDQVAGAGALLGMKTNDSPLVNLELTKQSCRFVKKQKLYFNGAITERTNLRQYITETAPYFLCNFIISDGKFALKPALPYNPVNGSINTGAVQIEQLFTNGNILEDSYKVEYLRSEERRPFKAVVRYRHEKEDKLPEERSVEVVLKGEIQEDFTIDLLPQEQFDLTQFCTSENHAIMVAKYFIALRNLVTHTISFSTTLEGLNIAAGSYIKVITKASPYSSAENGTIDSNGVITSVNELSDGQHDIIYFKSGSDDIDEGTMNVSNGKVVEEKFKDSVFTLKGASVKSTVYVVEQLTFSDQGTVDIVASEHPCDDGDRSRLASLVTSDRFRIF